MQGIPINHAHSSAALGLDGLFFSDTQLGFWKNQSAIIIFSCKMPNYVLMTSAILSFK